MTDSLHPPLAIGRPANLRAPAAAVTNLASPPWTHALSVRLFMMMVFFIPVQLELDAFKAIIDSRLPPGDIFLALSVLLAPASFRITRQALGYLPFALLATLAYGAIISLLLQGGLSSHALQVKLMGAVVLTVMGTLTLTYARRGYTARILRVFLQGVAFWGVVAYIDWRVVDIMPWLDEDVASRFGSMQFDPNNAGATFAVAMMISWRYGRRLFATRAAWMAMTSIQALALGLTLSRGAMIGTTAAVMVVLIVDNVTAERWMRYLAVGVVIISALFALGIVDGAVEDFSQRPDNVGDRNSLVAESVDRWADTGGLGIGLGTFRVEVDQVVHNTAIWLVTEMSLPGLIYFIAIIGIPAHACLRLRAHDRELAIALLAAHIVMVVASVGIEALYQRTWWLIIGCAVWPTAHVRQKQIEAVMRA